MAEASSAKGVADGLSAQLRYVPECVDARTYVFTF